MHSTRGPACPCTLRSRSFNATTRPCAPPATLRPHPPHSRAAQAQYEKLDRRVRATAVLVPMAVLFVLLPTLDRVVAVFICLAYGRVWAKPDEVGGQGQEAKEWGLGLCLRAPAAA